MTGNEKLNQYSRDCTYENKICDVFFETLGSAIESISDEYSLIVNEENDLRKRYVKFHELRIGVKLKKIKSGVYTVKIYETNIIYDKDPIEIFLENTLKPIVGSHSTCIENNFILYNKCKNKFNFEEFCTGEINNALCSNLEELQKSEN